MPEKVVDIPGVGNVAFPDSMSDTEISAQAARLYRESQQQTTTTATPSEPESATSRFLGGAWKNLNPITALEGLYSGVTHPIDTIKAIGQAQGAELGKAGENFRQGRYSEAVGHGAAGLLPLIGPASAAAGERIGSGDVAGGLGEATGLLAPVVGPAAVRGAGQAVRGTVAGVRAIPAGAEALDAVANMADRASTARMVDVAAPKVGGQVKLRMGAKMAKIAPDLVRDPDLGALSREGLTSKVRAKLADATAELDDAAASRPPSAQVQTGPIVKALDDRIAQLTAQPVEGSKVAPRAVGDWQLSEDGFKRDVQAEPLGQAVQSEASRPELDTLAKIRNEVAQLGPVAPYESVRRIRQAWDQVAKVKYSPAMSPDFLKNSGEATGAMKGAGALRDALASADPVTAAANAKYALFKSADDILTATEETERARPRVLRGVASKTAGAMIGAESGGVGGAVAGVMLAHVLQGAAELAPTAKIVVARQLASVADLLRGGQGQLAEQTLRTIARKLPTATVPATQVGQATDAIPQQPRAAR